MVCCMFENLIVLVAMSSQGSQGQIPKAKSCTLEAMVWPHVHVKFILAGKHILNLAN